MYNLLIILCWFIFRPTYLNLVDCCYSIYERKINTTKLIVTSRKTKVRTLIVHTSVHFLLSLWQFVLSLLHSRLIVALVLQCILTVTWIAFEQPQQYQTFDLTKYFIYARLLIVDPLPVYCYVFILLSPVVGRCTGSEWPRVMAISAVIRMFIEPIRRVLHSIWCHSPTQCDGTQLDIKSNVIKNRIII